MTFTGTTKRSIFFCFWHPMPVMGEKKEPRPKRLYRLGTAAVAFCGQSWSTVHLLFKCKAVFSHRFVLGTFATTIWTVGDWNRGVTRFDGARGKKLVWCPHIRTWGISEANVLYWRKNLWHCWDFPALPVFSHRLVFGQFATVTWTVKD